MEREKLREIMMKTGAVEWGTCTFSALVLGEDAKRSCEADCPGAAGVIVAAFPYFAGDVPGNLSLYARGEDYHRCVTRRLEQAAAELRELCPQHHFAVGADNSPLDERQCARLAGVGVTGRHGLVMVEGYGSWVFLGTILTDLLLPSAERPAPDCIGCGACVRACPGGALREEKFDEEKCLSALTQKKGQLPPEQEMLVRKHPLIWGCDICQRVCPYNREVKLSPLDDLAGRGEVEYLPSLTQEDMEGLSNKTFRAKYGNRAFAWRGPAVIRRNLDMIHDS